MAGSPGSPAIASRRLCQTRESDSVATSEANRIIASWPSGLTRDCSTNWVAARRRSLISSLRNRERAANVTEDARQHFRIDRLGQCRLLVHRDLFQHGNQVRGQAQVVPAQLKADAWSQGSITALDPAVIAAGGHVQGGYPTPGPGLDGGAVQVAAGVQGHQMALPGQRGTGTQGVGNAKFLIDPGPLGQGPAGGAQGGVDVEAFHRDLPVQAEEPAQVALAATPVDDRPAAGPRGLGEGLDLGLLAAGDFPGPTAGRRHLGDGQRRGHGQRHQLIHLGQEIAPLAARQVPDQPGPGGPAIVVLGFRRGIVHGQQGGGQGGLGGTPGRPRFPEGLGVPQGASGDQERIQPLPVPGQVRRRHYLRAARFSRRR